MAVSDAPLEDERFGGGVRVGNIQIIDAQSINRRRVLIQVDFHGQRCALQNSKSFYTYKYSYIYPSLYIDSLVFSLSQLTDLTVRSLVNFCPSWLTPIERRGSGARFVNEVVISRSLQDTD